MVDANGPYCGSALPAELRGPSISYMRLSARVASPLCLGQTAQVITALWLVVVWCRLPARSGRGLLIRFVRGTHYVCIASGTESFDNGKQMPS